MQASGCALESKMAAVIGSFYREQFVLLDYLCRLDSNGCFSLVETTDPKDYLHILDKVTVAVPEGDFKFHLFATSQRSYDKKKREKGPGMEVQEGKG